jgi:hypothetical protein
MNTSTCQHILRALRGQTIIVIGGDRRDEAIERLQRTFDLFDVVHRPTRKSDASPQRFTAALRRSNVVLAIALRGLLRTHHGKQLHTICRLLGIPLIDCFHIPHPNKLMAEIVHLRLLDVIMNRGRRAS